MSKMETNIAKVFDSGSLHHKQSLINNIRQSVQSPFEAMSKYVELTKVPLNKRDVFFYIIEFMLKVNQFTNGYNLEVALLAAKIETVRRVTNYKLNNSKNHYLYDGFDFLIGPEMITHHDINESEIDLDNKTTDLQELKRILLQMDQEEDVVKLDFILPSVMDSDECSAVVESDSQKSTSQNMVTIFPVCKILDVKQNINSPSSGIFSLNCLVEDASYKEHDVLVIYSNQTGKNRYRVVGYDLNLKRFVRLTHLMFDENVLLHLSNTSMTESRLCSVKERSIIKVHAKKIMHNLYCDLLIVKDDSVNVREQLSAKKYVECLQNLAVKNNPNELWQYMKKNYLNLVRDDQIDRITFACIRTTDGASIRQPELFYLARIKNSRIEHEKGYWFCCLYRKDVAWYKLRIFDLKVTSGLDKGKIYRFNGVALIEFKAPTLNGRDPIVDVLKLSGEIELERPSTKQVKTGESNYLQAEKAEPIQNQVFDSDGFEDDLFSNDVDDFYVNDLAYELHDAQELIDDDYGDESFPDESENAEDQFDFWDDESYYHQMAYDQLEEEQQIYADILSEDYSPEKTIQKAYETANDVCRILWPN